MAAARGDWSEADFEASLETLGCSTIVVTALRGEIASYYSAGLIPRADDDLATQLAIDADELEVIVERLFRALDLPEPTGSDPEQIPSMVSVGEIAVYIQRRYDELTTRSAAAL